MIARRSGVGSSRHEKEREKLIQERLQVLLSTLLREDDNKYCADCDAKGPRWASWNLGLFLCIRCAGIHRNLGVHISKVKSVNLDSWTPHQVASMQAVGNSRARALYEGNLPTEEDFRRPQTESALETFIRAKYEKKKYLSKDAAIPSKAPDFPEGWTQLIEAEKQKKDIKQIRLPSHTLAKAAASNQPTPRPSGNTTTGINNTLVKAESASSGIADLIGINDDTPKDSSSSSNSFDAFAEATPAPVPSSNADPQTKSTEEEDFFSSSSALPASGSCSTQVSSSASEKKMSNDSIMALFSQSGNSHSSNQSSQNAFNQNGYMPNFNSSGLPTGNNNGFGYNMGANQSDKNPFMAPTGNNQIMNQFNGLNLGGGPSSNGMIPNPSAPKATDSLAGLDGWNGF